MDHNIVVANEVKFDLFRKSSNYDIRTRRSLPVVNQILLPSGIFEYSETTNLVVKDHSVTHFPDEQDIKPAACSGR